MAVFSCCPKLAAVHMVKLCLARKLQIQELYSWLERCVSSTKKSGERTLKLERRTEMRNVRKVSPVEAACKASLCCFLRSLFFRRQVTQAKRKPAHISILISYKHAGSCICFRHMFIRKRYTLAP